jgi:NADPH-dependent 2,4-dienoyl-CoA reductase/sulfur reductase-like enzyme
LTKSIQCSVNPETGHEKDSKITPLRGKKVAVTVVGGGPAGLEAARTAAMRGCRVVLFERSDRLGGQMRIACIPPGKDKIAWTVAYYENQMKTLGIDVKISQEADVAGVLDTSPDIVIVATGSSPSPAVVSELATRVFTPDQILSSQALPAPGTAAVIGAGGIGCETALYLSQKGFEVSLIEELKEIALDLEPITAMDLRKRIAKNGIAVNLNCRLTSIREDCIKIERKGRETSEIAPRVVVWAAGRIPNNSFVRHMKASSFSGRCHLIGDAHTVGKLHDAIHAGYRVIRELN